MSRRSVHHDAVPSRCYAVAGKRGVEGVKGEQAVNDIIVVHVARDLDAVIIAPCPKSALLDGSFRITVDPVDAGADPYAGCAAAAGPDVIGYLLVALRYDADAAVR